MHPVLAVSFRAPERLWLLTLVAVLGLAHVVRSSRRQTYAARFTNLALLDTVLPRRPGWRRHVPVALLLASATALVVALAEPTREHRVPRERATIVLAIDTSLSMKATDVEPNRITAIKAAATRFVAGLPERTTVGLVAITKRPRLLVPPTLDRDAVIAEIEQVRLGQGTAVGEAIAMAVDAIALAVDRADAGDAPRPDSPVPARVVVLTDGDSRSGRPAPAAARAARRAGISVSTIAFGTPEGRIALPGRDRAEPVPVRPERLADIAAAGGGTAFSASSEHDLDQVYADIGASVSWTTEPRDIGVAFVAAALALLLGASTLAQRWSSRLP